MRLLGVPVKLSRTPGDPARAPGPALGADTEAVLAEAGYGAEEIGALLEAGAVAGAGREGGWLISGVKPGLKMSELADARGVSAATIKHYLREGLLGGDDDIVRTSRNMAYYPPEFVERIRHIKRLQERALPAAAADQGAARRAGLGGPVERAEVAERFGDARQRLDRLEEIGVLTPGPGGYDPDDVKIIEAIARFRAGGYDEAIGFTVYDTLRYREALQPLVEEEVRVLIERLAGDVDPDARGGDHALGPRAAARPDRRDALQAAARRAGAAAMSEAVLRAARRRPLPLDGPHGRPVGRPQPARGAARRPAGPRAGGDGPARGHAARARHVRDPRTRTCG